MQTHYLHTAIIATQKILFVFTVKKNRYQFQPLPLHHGISHWPKSGLPGLHSK